MKETYQPYANLAGMNGAILGGESKFSFNREVIGRIIDPATTEGSGMTQWVLKANGNFVPRHTAVHYM